MRPLYQHVAAELAQRITEGVYAPGARLPGVRSVARQRGVSVATVIAAYRRLEDDGHIEARARSGFYVRARRAIHAIEPEREAAASPPRLVTGQEMAMALIKAANDPGIVQLGAAVPDPDYLPTPA